MNNVVKEFKGCKPLVHLQNKLYLFSKGKLWTVQDGKLHLEVSLEKSFVMDKNRFFVRMLRREPKLAVPLDENKILMASKKKLILIDVSSKEIHTIASSRKGFSDPLNICTLNGRWLAVWGDYGPNPNNEAINIYGLKSSLEVEILYTFLPGTIRHVHNIVPKREKGFYIFTGDQGENVGLYSANEDFSIVEAIKVGKQQYRAVVGFDTIKGLLYATDAVNEKNYIYLLKNSCEPQIICELNGSCIYGTKYADDYYFSTTVEPDENVNKVLSWLSRKRGKGILSDKVYLMRIDKEMRVTIEKKYQKDCLPMKLFQYGAIQFPYGESTELWSYPVAVKKFDGRAIQEK